MQLEIEFDVDKLQIKLNEFKGNFQKLTPLMREISEIMKHAVDENFATEGHGNWPPVKNRSGRILQDTGRLKNSIQSYFDAKKAVVGTNVIYARIHNFGGRTSAHTIKCRDKKALAFNLGNRKVYAKQVNHPGSNIPARPFLILNKTELEDIKDSINKFIRIQLEESI